MARRYRDVREPGRSGETDDVHADLTGQLLVATPVLDDPNFTRTVVYVVEHNDDGALGLVVNRASHTPVHVVLPGLAAPMAQPDNVFWGGPVSPDTAICLGRGPDGVGLIDIDDPPDDVEVRVFAGYAGWSEKQLEFEMGLGAWWVVDADGDDAMTDEPETLWRRVLRRQGGRLAKWASLPDDVRLN
jgi:putative transcriptional regulator